MIYEFKPYTSCPPKTDPNFIAVSKGGYSHCIIRDKKTGYTLPNCVGEVHGEWLHLLTQAVGLEKAKEYESQLCRNNAEKYFAHDDKFARSRVPELGAIIVWDGKGSLAGHVAVVTEVKDNGDIKVNASNYSGTKFYTASYKKSNGYRINSNYTFLGFILPPVLFGKFVTIPVKRDSAKDQVHVTIENLNVRVGVDKVLLSHKGAKGTDAPRQGFCAPGYYNVLDTVNDGTHTWYKIDEEGLWIAQVTGVEFLENDVLKYEVTATVPWKQLGKVKMFLDTEGIKYKVKQL